MKLDDLNSLEHNKKQDDFLSSFMQELQNIVSNFIKNTSSHALENTIYVVRDINDEKLSLVNVDDGQEIDIYAACSKDKIESLHSKGISNNIYEISKEDFYSLNLGSNITIKDRKCIPYSGEIKIKSPVAAAKLEDMYFCLEQEKDAQYLVSEISDEKIYLSDIKEGGYFSIPKEPYPDFKVGNIVKKIDGKYTLI